MLKNMAADNYSLIYHKTTLKDLISKSNSYNIEFIYFYNNLWEIS
jgi:hypothetical protein